MDRVRINPKKFGIRNGRERAKNREDLMWALKKVKVHIGL